MLGELLKRDFVFFDNGYGWLLMKRGLKPGQRPDVMNVTSPDAVEDIHRQAVEAGSDIICTNTFGANSRVLKDTGYSVDEIVAAAVGIAKRAAEGRALVALDIGPIGEFISPFGPLSFDESYELYREQVLAGKAHGADLVAIETMSDLFELKAAVLAVRENTDLPVLAMMTFDKSGRTFTGCLPESFAITAEGLGAAAVGINCSLQPSEIFPIAERITKSTSLPLIVKPNAGMPNSTGGYDVPADEFARQMARFASIGVKIVGGCCGTTAEYIRELRRVFSSLRPGAVEREPGRRICTPFRVAHADGIRPDKLIEPDLSPGAAADALELSDIDEVLTVRLPAGMPREDVISFVRGVQSQSDRPLCLVSEDAEALMTALRYISGTAAVRFLGRSQLKAVDAVEKYGAIVV